MLGELESLRAVLKRSWWCFSAGLRCLPCMVKLQVLVSLLFCNWGMFVCESSHLLLQSDMGGKIALNSPNSGAGKWVGYIAYHIWLSLLLNQIKLPVHISSLELQLL